MEKFKDLEIWQINFRDLHDVMYMSIKPKENNETFKEQGRMKVLQSWEQHNSSDFWTHYFQTYYCQFDMCSFSTLVFQNMFV
jgi:hypothetical protein